MTFLPPRRLLEIVVSWRTVANVDSPDAFLVGVLAGVPPNGRVQLSPPSEVRGEYSS